MKIIRMDASSVENTRQNILFYISNFSRELTTYADTMNSLRTHPEMKGLFIERASHLVEEVRDAESKIKSHCEELANVIKNSTDTKVNTEEDYTSKFIAIASDDFSNLN